MDGHPLSQEDLKFIASFGTLVTNRPPGQTLCHKVRQRGLHLVALPLAPHLEPDSPVAVLRAIRAAAVLYGQ